MIFLWGLKIKKLAMRMILEKWDREERFRERYYEGLR